MLYETLNLQIRVINETEQKEIIFHHGKVIKQNQ